MKESPGMQEVGGKAESGILEATKPEGGSG